jgi:hypothetical protein
LTAGKKEADFLCSASYDVGMEQITALPFPLLPSHPNSWILNAAAGSLSAKALAQLRDGS